MANPYGAPPQNGAVPVNPYATPAPYQYTPVAQPAATTQPVAPANPYAAAAAAPAPAPAPTAAPNPYATTAPPAVAAPPPAPAPAAAPAPVVSPNPYASPLPIVSPSPAVVVSPTSAAEPSPAAPAASIYVPPTAPPLSPQAVPNDAVKTAPAADAAPVSKANMKDVVLDMSKPEDQVAFYGARSKLRFIFFIRFFVMISIIIFVAISSNFDDVSDLYQYDSNANKSPSLTEAVLGTTSGTVKVAAYGFDKDYAFMPTACVSGTATKAQINKAMLQYIRTPSGGEFVLPHIDVYKSAFRIGITLILGNLIETAFLFITYRYLIKKNYLEKGTDVSSVLGAIAGLAVSVLTGTNFLILVNNIPDEGHVVGFTSYSAVACVTSASGSGREELSLIKPSQIIGAAQWTILASFVLLIVMFFVKIFYSHNILVYKRDNGYKWNKIDVIFAKVLCVSPIPAVNPANRMSTARTNATAV